MGIETDAVDAINSVFGKQHRNRAIHAKGIVVAGRFTPSPAARELTYAAHLQDDATAITVRFSNFSGNPDTSDTDPMASPRGMAVRFHLEDGSHCDMVTHSFNGFPVATVEEFRQLLRALAASGPKVPHPSPADRFLGEHAAARAFLEAAKPPPASYATLRYFGVNSFELTNGDGEMHFGRFRFAPTGGEQLLSNKPVDSDYLREELRLRLADGPLGFALQVQLAEDGDPIEDPSQPWPESRRLVTLGELAIDTLIGHGEAIEGPLVFAPAHVPPGIEPADPMLRIRDAAYLVSYRRRHEELQPPADLR